MTVKVFVSCSGETSRRVAVALREWLPLVLQTLDLYVSSEDIDKGVRWSADIGHRLDESGFGILCVTPENISAPWLNFEAGALAKSFEVARVTPFLFGLTAADLVGPISQFQATEATRDDITRLVRSMNAVTAAPLDDARLTSSVEVWWPKLQEALTCVSAAPRKSTETSRSSRDLREMLEEVLDIARSLQRQLARGSHSGTSLDPSVGLHHGAYEDIKEVMRQCGWVARLINLSGGRAIIYSAQPTSTQFEEVARAAKPWGFTVEVRPEEEAPAYV